MLRSARLRAGLLAALVPSRLEALLVLRLLALLTLKSAGAAVVLA